MKHKGKKRQQEKKGNRKQPRKKNMRIKTQEDMLLWKLVGIALLAFATFVGAALASYDWQSVAALNPEPTVTTNLVRVIGNWFAYGVFKAPVPRGFTSSLRRSVPT